MELGFSPGIWNFSVAKAERQKQAIGRQQGKRICEKLLSMTSKMFFKSR
jgi:hypothetical protein|tara:strand:- start:506 stop:652 length:147 start_codon:yes stop_codon:yes gene_type:complete